MAVATASTEWPSTPIAPGVKQLISLFFQLVDQNSEEVGDRLAGEVFTPDAKLLTVQGAAVGSAEIAKSRENAWEVIVSRRHEVVKVYASDADGSDLLLLGKLTTGLKDGSTTLSEFCARVVVEGPADAAPKMKMYQAFPGAKVTSEFAVEKTGCCRGIPLWSDAAHGPPPLTQFERREADSSRAALER